MRRITYASVPFVRSHITTADCMFLTILALLPSAGYGIYEYGLKGAEIIGLCIISMVVFDTVLNLIFKRKNCITDYSAVVTGLIGGLILPASVPLYFPVILAAAASLSKQLCGGIGKNYLNPAAFGKLVLFIAFNTAMRDYSGSRFGAAAALTAINEGTAVTLKDMLLGGTAGPIGTGNAAAVLIGAFFLFIVGITDIMIPLTAMIGFALFFAFFGSHGLSAYYLVQQFAGGSFLFTVFFMAQDYTTSPMSPKGKAVYGLLIGILTGIARKIGFMEYGSIIALLIANASVRYIDIHTLPESFGVAATVRKVKKRRQQREKREKVYGSNDMAAGLARFEQFENNAELMPAMEGSETAGTINAESMEAYNNRRSVGPYDNVDINNNDPFNMR